MGRDVAFEGNGCKIRCLDNEALDIVITSLLLPYMGMIFVARSMHLFC